METYLEDMQIWLPGWFPEVPRNEPRRLSPVRLAERMVAKRQDFG